MSIQDFPLVSEQFIIWFYFEVMLIVKIIYSNVMCVLCLYAQMSCYGPMLAKRIMHKNSIIWLFTPEVLKNPFLKNPYDTRHLQNRKLREVILIGVIACNLESKNSITTIFRTIVTVSLVEVCKQVSLRRSFVWFDNCQDCINSTDTIINIKWCTETYWFLIFG